MTTETTVKAKVMDTASASLENKPLKETEEPLDDASHGPEWLQLASAMQGRQEQKQNKFKSGWNNIP